MTLKRVLSAILFILLLLAACKKERPQEQSQVIARVGDKYLYKSDLEKILPPKISYEDSINITQNFINQWITDQLLIRYANEELSDEKEYIEQKVENFRKSLLIYELKQKMINEQVDTVVSDTEIAQYYEIHKQNFVLNQAVIKGIFIKAPKNTDLNRLKNLLLDIDANRSAILNLIGEKGKFDDFRNKWQEFYVILEQMPLTKYNENNLPVGRIIQTQDNDYVYLLKVLEIRRPGEYKPLEICKDDIKKIILNKRAQEFLDKLERQLYEKAQKNGLLEINLE